MKKSESGQALIIVLLIMAVGLTMGLSIISRSITDVKISQQEAESARAFSAAEAGIEEALSQNLAPGNSATGEIGDVTYNVSAKAQGSDTSFDFGGNKFSEGEIQTVWLVEHDSGGELDPSNPFPGTTITVCWGDDVNDKTAIEVSLIYNDGGFKVGRGAYDANSGRIPTNGFNSADDLDGGNCGEDLAFAEQIDLTELGFSSGTPYALRLKVLYNAEPEPIAVTSGVAFPSQGTCYQSTASFTGTGVTRKVQQCQFHKAPPGIFDYVLFSEGSLTHN